MYPEKPWKNISKEAISCIQHFLVVQQDQRYTVDQALLDPWISDKQCQEDIARLEEEVGMQWLSTTLDQAGNEVEIESKQSNSLNERILNLFILLIILQIQCFFVEIFIFHTFDLSDLFLGIREPGSEKETEPEKQVDVIQIATSFLMQVINVKLWLVGVKCFEMYFLWSFLVLFNVQKKLNITTNVV